MGNVKWDAENDRKVSLFEPVFTNPYQTRSSQLLLNLINANTKEINVDYLAIMFPGVTPKAITERISKLRREAKSTLVPTTTIENPETATSNNDNTTAASGEGGNKRKRKPRHPKSKKRKLDVEDEAGAVVADDDDEGLDDIKRVKREELNASTVDTGVSKTSLVINLDEVEVEVKNETKERNEEATVDSFDDVETEAEGEDEAWEIESV
ncbi:hypothetical protein MMC28_009889 [Mycoblastus sanguinarius]|nr:hypothetical protein [Mycoblastus sanguinarius]